MTSEFSSLKYAKDNTCSTASSDKKEVPTFFTLRSEQEEPWRRICENGISLAALGGPPDHTYSMSVDVEDTRGRFRVLPTGETTSYELRRCGESLAGARESEGKKNRVTEMSGSGSAGGSVGWGPSDGSYYLATA